MNAKSQSASDLSEAENGRRSSLTLKWLLEMPPQLKPKRTRARVRKSAGDLARTNNRGSAVTTDCVVYRCSASFLPFGKQLRSVTYV
jgi:hypothetical protein